MHTKEIIKYIDQLLERSENTEEEKKYLHVIRKRVSRKITYKELKEIIIELMRLFGNFWLGSGG